MACVLSRTHNLSRLAVATIADVNSDVSIRSFPIDRTLAEVAVDIGMTVGLRGADAHYAAVAKHQNVPLVTWDAELLARASPGGLSAMAPIN